jgi:tRNA A-37 threonylcarbamoyl transferase component Bud32
MSAEPDPLSKLSASIADGESIDWDGVRALASDDEVRKLVDYLRIVAGVADVHRSQVADTFEVPLESALDPESTRTDEPGVKRWGHLLLVRKIGEGAYGEVYEALDTWLDHPRALKLLKPQAAVRATAREVLHEARKLVRVRHPNVVMVHGADSHDGRIGFWMDLIEGQTLEERVHEGRLSPGEAIYIGQELCRALTAVHHANLLHRDIKAQNVMRASDGGRIILMDFGAGEFRDEPGQGRPKGTPLYLAPELFAGGPATTESDIYALGVLLYYVVTGTFPVIGNNYTDLALNHARGVRRHLRDARPDLPDTFVSVIERAINSDPGLRFRSAGDFYAALEDRQLPVKPKLEPEPTPHVIVSDPPLGLQHYVGIGVFVLVLIEAFGFVAARTFEVAFHVDPAFTAGFVDYFTIGFRGALPFVLNWIVGILLLALLSAMGFMIGPVLKRFVEVRVFAGKSWDPKTGASAILIGGIVTWMVVTWFHWSLFASLFLLQLAPPGTTASASTLGPAFHAQHLSYSEFAAVITFILLMFAWRWWPRPAHDSDVKALRTLKWATLTVAIAIMVVAIAPRRPAWDRFEVVTFENQDWCVIGKNDSELLLYAPDRIGALPRRVSKAAHGLVSKDTLRRLTD